jgi:hypothetical protein
MELTFDDSYWQAAHARADYEDYAPAYCVGAIGYAQYGGTFEDAEKSLWANWERIKGDSRLTLDQAREAMRAAWRRAGRGTQPARD